MSSYSIKDLENLSGIKAHTLRIWEQRYNLMSPERSDTNIRTYSDEDLKLVLNIALLKEHGYKISEIAKLSAVDMAREVMAISEETLNYPDQIHALTIAMIDFDEERFEKVMATSTLQFGFENMMINIIYPFFSRIGTLWLTGSIGPAQEHFITNLIRQKTIVAIDGQVPKKTASSKVFVLYTPEGELHEIGILFANYILRARNHKVVYLGQSLPFDELLYVCSIHKPDFVFTAITSVPSHDVLQPYINKLAEALPQATILLTGFQVVGQGHNCPPNVQIIMNIRQLIEVAEIP